VTLTLPKVDIIAALAPLDGISHNITTNFRSAPSCQWANCGQSVSLESVNTDMDGWRVGHRELLLIYQLQFVP
jgi:hypothetical protein